MRRAWPGSRRLRILLLLAIVVAPLLAAGYRLEGTACRQPVSLQPGLVAFAGQVAAPQPAGNGASPPGRLGTLLRPVAVQGTVLLLRFKNQDRLAYPAHVAVAEVLQHLRCSPYAVAVQWLKAGAHASTSQQQVFVQAGLRREAGRVGGAPALATYLRQFLDPTYDPRGRCTIARLEGNGRPADQCG